MATETIAASNAAIPSYSNTSRPAASAVGASPDNIVEIWNTTQAAPNFSNGTNWFDAVGNILA